jgi:Mrp family chromosome partitioning ATPase
MRQERRVVLVDANLSQPAVARRFGAVPVPGLVECVCGGESAREALQPTSVQNLFVLPAGQMRVSPARVYDSTDLAAVADELAGHCELVVFDLPPLGRASCANRLPAALDGVLLVVEAEGVHWEVAQRAKELLQYAGARIVGCVLNKWRDAA